MAVLLLAAFIVGYVETHQLQILHGVCMYKSKHIFKRKKGYNCTHPTINTVNKKSTIPILWLVALGCSRQMPNQSLVMFFPCFQFILYRNIYMHYKLIIACYDLFLQLR